MSAVKLEPISSHGIRWGRWVTGAVIALVVILLAVRVMRPSEAKVPDSDSAGPIELAPADVATVAPRALSRSLPLSGTLEPIVQTMIKSQVTGEVLEVTVREGQTVKRGDVLVRVDPSNLNAEVDSQQATLEKARADMQLATQNRDNSKTLLEQHFISQNAYDSTVNAYAESVANVKLAEAQLRMAQINLGYTVVRAPFDGTVAKRSVDPGEEISPDVPLMALVDLAQMELQAPAPASEIPSIKVDQHAAFHVNGFGTRSFDGVVRRINPIADESSRSVLVYLAVANPDGALKGGMFAEADLTLDRTQSVAAIPLAAVHSDAGVTYVFTLKNGVVDKKTVDLGLRAENEGYVEVRGGLADGEQVIVANIEALKAGTKAVMAGGSAAAPAATAAKASPAAVAAAPASGG